MCVLRLVFLVFGKMPKDGIVYSKSALEFVDVGTAVKNYHLGSSNVVSVPKDEEQARYPPKDMVAVYVDYFKTGLWMLVCELVPRVLEYYWIHLTQLKPNVIGRIIGFEILCRAEGRDPTIDVFRYFFQMKVSGDWFSFSTLAGVLELMYGFSDSIKGWKRRFFFLKKTVLGISGEVKWRETGEVKDSPPGPGEYDAMSVSQGSPLIFNYRKLTERTLIAACMSLVPVSPAFPLKKDCISN